MRRYTHIPAIVSALVLILCCVGFSYVMFMMIASPARYTLPAASPVVHPMLQLSRATGTVLLLGYAAGVIGWILTFLMRRDGVHRMLLTETVPARRRALL